jgi:hypothetical protein
VFGFPINPNLEFNLNHPDEARQSIKNWTLIQNLHHIPYGCLSPNIYIYIYLIYLSIYRSIDRSIYLSIYLSLYLSILSIYLSYLSIYPMISIYLSHEISHENTSSTIFGYMPIKCPTNIGCAKKGFRRLLSSKTMWFSGSMLVFWGFPFWLAPHYLIVSDSTG